MTTKERIESSIDLAIIDLKASGKETVSLLEVLRNSLDFIDKSEL